MVRQEAGRWLTQIRIMNGLIPSGRDGQRWMCGS